MLEPYGVQADFPETAGSEGLLQLLPASGVTGEKVMIVRGSGGRELLAETLNARGVSVRYLEVYQRVPVSYEDLGQLPDGVVVVVTSGEILTQFTDQVGGRLNRFKLVVPSQRIAALAESLGGEQVTIAADASDQALYDAVLKTE